MHFSNDVDPNAVFCSTGEACQILGITRNELRALMLRKQLSWDIVSGLTMLYRASVEALKTKRENAGKAPNPYAKTQEASHVSP